MAQQPMYTLKNEEETVSSLNRLHNASNPNQGDYKKVLCVCSAGLLRSPTAAIVIQAAYGHNTRAVGSDEGHALIPIETVHIVWADEVVVMDQWQQDALESRFPAMKLVRVINLEIEDNYVYMDPELQDLIIERYPND